MATFTAGSGTTDFEATGYLPEEVRNAAEEAYEKTGRMIDEHVEKMKKATAEMTQMHSEVMKAVQKQSEELFTRSWQGMWSRLGEQVSKLLSDAVSRGLRNSMSSAMIADIKPGLGDTGAALGKTLGQGIGMALGAELGPIGMKIAGDIGGAVGGTIIGGAQMQYEGFRMLGARAAPTAYAGRAGEGIDFEKTGREYRAAIREIVVATGASADAVEKLAQSLSRVGVAFLEGGKEEAAFALAAERAMNLQAGAVEKLQTRAIREYGEAVQAAHGPINLINMETLKMTMLEKDHANAMAGAWKAGNNWIDALGQIESGVKNTSVSLESMSMISVTLLDTMTKVGNVRPGAAIKTATSLAGAFLPQPGQDAADEIRRSDAYTKLLSASNPALLARLEAERGKHHNAGIATTADIINATDPNFGMQFFLGMGSGVAKMVNEGGAEGIPRAQTFVSTMLGAKLSGTDLVRWMDAQEEIRKSGITGDMTVEQMEKKARASVEGSKAWETLKDLKKRAEEQGSAQQSALDRIGNELAYISEWTNGWSGNARDWVLQTFGLLKQGEHGSWAQFESVPRTLLGEAIQAGVTDRLPLPTIPGVGGVSSGEEGDVQRNAMHISHQAAHAIREKTSDHDGGQSAQ